MQSIKNQRVRVKMGHGPNFSPEKFIQVIKAARAELQEIYCDEISLNDAVFSEISPAAELLNPNNTRPVTFLFNKYFPNGINTESKNCLFVSVRLFESGQINSIFDFFFLRGFQKTARQFVESGNITVDEFCAGEFWFRQKGAFTDKLIFRAKSKYYLSKLDCTGEKFTRISDSKLCPLSGQFWCESDFVIFKTFFPLLGESLSATFYTYSIFEYAKNEDFLYIDYFSAYIKKCEFGLFEIVKNQDSGFHQHYSELFLHPDGFYYEQPAGIVCGPEDAVSPYHSGQRSNILPIRFSRNSQFLAGFEIEKEDYAVKCSILHSDFEKKLPAFRKERDGSLCARSGFEFITPPLELSPKGIKAIFEKSEIALSHVNADFSIKCGGHVHISRSGLSGLELFNTIKGYLPILHALFPARADGNNSYYCKAKSARNLINDREKYQSINILNDRIEIRIFGAVRGLENLLWRAALLKKLFENPCENAQIMYANLPALFCHFRKVYDAPESLEKLIKRIEKYALKFEFIALSPPDEKVLIYRPFSGKSIVKARKSVLN